MRLVPTGDNVLIRRDPVKDKIGNIVLPDSAQEKPTKGRVLAVGPDVKGIVEGDYVLHKKYMGTEVEVGAETLLMIAAKPEVIIAVIKE